MLTHVFVHNHVTKRISSSFMLINGVLIICSGGMSGACWEGRTQSGGNFKMRCLCCFNVSATFMIILESYIFLCDEFTLDRLNGSAD